MRVLLILFFVFLIGLFFIPLAWSENIEFDLPKFTEEYYKSWFSLFHLLIAFTFFTVLYEYLKELNAKNKLIKLKKSILELFDAVQTSNTKSTILQLNAELQIYIDIAVQNLIIEDDLIMFYEFLKSSKRDVSELALIFDNPNAKKAIISKINSNYTNYRTIANNI